MVTTLDTSVRKMMHVKENKWKQRSAALGKGPVRSRKLGRLQRPQRGKTTKDDGTVRIASEAHRWHTVHTKKISTTCCRKKNTFPKKKEE